MNKGRFSKLAKIGNEAKNIGNFDIANAAFAVALSDYFSLTLAERNATYDGPPPAWLLWETDDQKGEESTEAYFDLLVIETADPESGKLESLYIPVPLLDRGVAVTALKAAQVTERPEHNRETREPEENEIADLWAKLEDVVPVDEMNNSVMYILSSDEETE